MKAKRKKGQNALANGAYGPISYWPSHCKFVDMIAFCTRGTSHLVLRTPFAEDHIAETVDLHLDDVDSILWFPQSRHEGPRTREILARLEERISRDNDLRAAEILYAIATEASLGVLRLYLRKRELFDQVAPRRKFLPSLFSIHPNTADITKQMLADSKLGTQTDHRRQVGSRAYFTSDSPPNVYARAILTCIQLNQRREPVSEQQKAWKKFDKKEGVRTIVRPFPKYFKGLERIPTSITPKCVLDYWRKGKQILLEEVPDFHSRPEWREYHNRRYKGGAKAGTVQHAIFKDILVALKTLAGANKRQRLSNSTPE
jgi:hypothetical protein